MGISGVVSELQHERARLLANLGRIEKAIAALAPGDKSVRAVERRSGKRKPMSAARRQAISERMKRSWAKRKRTAKR